MHFKLQTDEKDIIFSLERIEEGRTLIVCEAAGIDQEFLDEDVPNLLFDLPKLIN